MILFNPPDDDLLIRKYETISLYQIGRSNISELSEFVFKMYSFHYLKKYQWSSSIRELESMRQSDMDHFDESVYFGFRNSKQELLGTIKATKRTENIIFPIEYEFDIDIEKTIEKENLRVDEVWHLGRLAIDSNLLRLQNTSIQSKRMLQLLLIHSLSVINHQPNNLMIAESDVLIHKTFQDLGLDMQIIGDRKNCLGSPTYPVILKFENMDKWLDENSMQEKSLIEVFL